MPDSFYESDGDRYVSTELTRGPWDPDAQHAGPPAALLGRELERLEDADEFQVCRLSFEIMRSVPIAPLRAEARIVRPGRRVQLIEGALFDDEGEVMRVRGWRLRTEPVELPDLPAPEPPVPVDDAEPGDFLPTGQEVGYHTAMDYRFVAGAFLEPGPATVWMRMRQPLIDAETPSPLQRVLAAADSGNGISATLDWRCFLHQRRSQRPPGADADRRVGLSRRGDAPAAQRGRNRRYGAVRRAWPDRACVANVANRREGLTHPSANYCIVITA